MPTNWSSRPRATRSSVALGKRETMRIGRSGGGSVAGGRQEIGEGRWAPLNRLTHPNGEGRAEHRPIGDEGVELAVFPARVDRGREGSEQRLIISAPGELGRESRQVHAHQDRAVAPGDQLM